MATATAEPTAPEGTETGPDPDNGKLFEVPRAKITIDDTDPNVIKLAFSGGIELDRGNPSDVALYNRLVAGKNVDLHVQAFVAGPKTTHRRDADGNVDTVIQTKSVIVHSIDDE
jgi:hypothetical protein